MSVPRLAKGRQWKTGPAECRIFNVWAALGSDSWTFGQNRGPFLTREPSLVTTGLKTALREARQVRKPDSIIMSASTALRLVTDPASGLAEALATTATERRDVIYASLALDGPATRVKIVLDESATVPILIVDQRGRELSVYEA